MKSGIIFLASAAIVSTGCATVDLQNMAGSSSTTVEAAHSDNGNVVERAVEKLRIAFASHGFSANVSQRKMHAAADMLLNGLSAKSVTSADEGYAATVRPVSVVVEDIQLARHHVEQTARAAEVYLEVAPSDRRFDAELSSLQTALMASERASRAFSEALPGGSVEALSQYKLSVDRLRDVTDEFGSRVRLARSQKLDSETAS